jgi:hypothetical protein
MSNFVRMFKPQFADLVEAGTKLQTVRPVPKRMPGPGDTISLRTWTGRPYCSKMRVLLEARITAVEAVEIQEHGIWCMDSYIRSRERLDVFARADGFEGWRDLAAWFQQEHGLPFKGILISWKATNSAKIVA